MTDNELLLAMSNLMDNKLQPIKKDLQSVKTELNVVKDDVQTLKTELNIVKDDVQTLKTELNVVKDDVQILNTKLKTVEGDVHSLQGDVHSLQGDVNNMQTGLHIVQAEVHQMKLYQENITLPRLDTIESCYTDTYNRYKAYADKMDSYFMDMELVKQVVAEHSEKLQNIS